VVSGCLFGSVFKELLGRSFGTSFCYHFDISMSTMFFISFVTCDVIVISDLSYITPLYNNSQY
ncbi:hypothetical protein ORM92_29625, partial [Bacillus cereus]|uniref:hypothetical protein n=1 Tax=Bacillus cereus TaxID=1396 RepID=UPI002ABF71AB